MGREGVRTATELAISQPLISADVCDRIRSRKCPMIDLLDEIHSKTLIDKRRRGKVASTVDRNQTRNNSEVIQNQQRPQERWMCPDPAHTFTRILFSRSAIILRGVPQFSRSNSAGEILRPNSSSILIINSTVLIESNSWHS